MQKNVQKIAFGDGSSSEEEKTDESDLSYEDEGDEGDDTEDDTTDDDTDDDEIKDNQDKKRKHVNKDLKQSKKQKVEVIYQTPPILPTNLHQLLLLSKHCHDNNLVTYRDCKGLDKAYFPLQELSNLIGQFTIKQQITELIIRELQRNELETVELPHILLFGIAGLGKTSIISVLADIKSCIGTIRKKKVIFAHMPTSFIADVLGKTAQNTCRLFEEAKNGILVIDELHNISDNRHQFSSDSYSKSAADVMCSLLTPTPQKKVETTVIGCGYEKEIKRDFFSLNPGLASRFPTLFFLQPYTSEELRLIAMKKLHDRKLQVDNNILPIEMFQDLTLFPAFGRSVTVFVDHIISLHALHVFGKSPKNIISKEDVEQAFLQFSKKT